MAAAPPPRVSPFRPDVLAGQVALVTGGSSGIGLEIARQLGLHGAAVCITGRRQAVLDAAVADLTASGVRTAVGLQGDVRKPEDTAAWAAAAAARGRGGIDILVNCAAGNFLAAADALSPNGFRTVMDIDAVGTFSASRAAAAALKTAAARRAPAGGDGGGGDASGAVVINISATLHYGATWWQAHACAAKAAVDALTRALALEWGEAGVRVVGVAPGPVAGTAGLQKLAGVDAPSLTTSIASMIPLGRLASPWDIAAACVFLASPAARFVSGDTLVVDGGAWLWRPPAVPREGVAEIARRVEAASRAVTGARASKL